MTQQSQSGQSAGRIVAIIGGAIAGIVAVGLVVAGAVLLYAEGQKDNDGYVSTGKDRFHTRTYALATDDLDVNTDMPGWFDESHVLGHIRLKASSRAGKPIFVGIAPTKDVNAYLRGTGHATVTDVDYSPFRATYRTRAGDRPAPPVAQRFWTASANGTGTQTVDWKVRGGNWSVVVMNADGSRNVDAGVKAGSDAPWLPTVGWGSIGGGVVLAILAGTLVYVGVRRPREPRAPAGLAPVAA
jgi:hypothetical protein